MSYLSIPNVYDKTEISKKLNNQLQEKFNLNFNLSKDLKYNFFPRPHFIYKNTSILKDHIEISQIEKLKIFITLKNLFSYKNFEIQNLIVEKSNFNLNNQTYKFFIELLNTDLKNRLSDFLILKPIEEIEHVFKNLTKNIQIGFDYKNTSYFFYQLALNNNLIPANLQNPCLIPKATKNKTELEGSRKAHLRDGVRMTNFLNLLKTHKKKVKLDLTFI